ncbi:MAG: Eco57I restriction-modification methylase domain-containing protein [Chloroflexi bacterium]|nr:Eco57I restriction-modification methylase domain-containing protein [Chloroflexota bacterium]
MLLNAARVRNYLKDNDFRGLFIEELGWDHCKTDLQITVDGRIFPLFGLAEKRGMVAFTCDLPSDGCFPDYATRRKIETQVAKSVREHLIIYVDPTHGTQVWQWVKREPGKPIACREHIHYRAQSGDLLIQKLQTISFSLDEEGQITLPDVLGKVAKGFDVEHVTKHFYDRFKIEHAAFTKFVRGIPDGHMQRWYVSVMLNRLMFIYFVQKKGFLDGDPNYLRTKLAATKAHGKDRYYREFLCPLFFEGFARQETDRSPEAKALLGKVPYLNGGLFLRHQVEEQYGNAIEIPDAAFEKIYRFFEEYQWHLDERPLRTGNEINPDVLGYIFEKYINAVQPGEQKAKGAYYTQEDITGYISQNTIIPFLFDAARNKCKTAFEGAQSVWRLLQSDPDRYIYAPVKHGAALPLPPAIAVGLDDVSKRTEWNKSAPSDFALPTEIWREMVARRKRYEEVRAKLANGEIRDVNDLITYNLDIRQFALDVIENSEGPELLRAFWHAIEKVTVLDPTVGSGAFLFAALNVLEPLYSACLDRMRGFLDDLERSGEKHRPEKYADLRAILERIADRHKERYFVLKSIILNNLYGVDIMAEATEICKLRLFLKLVAQVDTADRIEPLPDIDFNIRSGNSLVGFATYDEVKKAVLGDRQAKMDLADDMQSIDESAENADHAFSRFREMQMLRGMQPEEFAAAKHELRERLVKLEAQLNRYLATQYGRDPNKEAAYASWLESHMPFHWFVEFYGILKRGGFDVIIGNPPYVEYNSVKKNYAVKDPDLLAGGNLHSMITARCLRLSKQTAYISMIVPIALGSTDRMAEIRHPLSNEATIWLSNYAIRPAKLFVGAEQRLSIFIASRKFNGRIFTTKYMKWNSGERDCLFQRLDYSEWARIATLRDVWPKLGSAVAQSVLEKVTRQDVALAQCLGASQSSTLYHKNTGIGYFVVVTRTPPECFINGKRTPSSRETPLVVKTPALASVVHCILSSSLFFLVYQQLSNCRDLNPSDIRTFRAPSTLLNEAALLPLSLRMQKSLIENSWLQVRHQRQTGEVRIQSFTPSLSKPITDEVDRLLAKHYGLNSEELDFVINYDIKYRVGTDSAEDEDSD